MRFSVITIVAAMVSVVAAQNCGGPCGTATVEGATISLGGSCPPGMTCTGVVTDSLPLGLGSVSVGVSDRTIY